MTDEGVVAPLQAAAAIGGDECYACLVGVWTGPESHGESCSFRRKAPKRDGVRHVIRTGEVHGRQSWECSCGRGGSVGEWGDVDLASDKHINYDAGDGRVDSSASFDAPWSQDAAQPPSSEASPKEAP